MQLQTEISLTGLHPRSENTVKVSRDFERGRASAEDLDAAFCVDSEELTKLESDLGFATISDGQLRWQDFIRPFSEGAAGLKGGADLSRWFDTNSFYRKPSAERKLDTEKPVSLEKYSDRDSLAKSKIRRKISLPGPYTLASLVENHFYNSKIDLIGEFGRVLRATINVLSNQDYSTVQINEPSLVYRYGESAITNPEHLAAFLSVFSDCISGLNIDIWLHTYFGDCSKILEKLVKLENVSTIGIDFTQTSLRDISSIQFDGKSLGCGCVDGRNSLLESPEWISGFCKQASDALNPKGIVILPSSDLKFLPRTAADGKLESMSKAKNLLNSKLA